MFKRLIDSHLFLLGSVPTHDDKLIPINKLPTNKQVLLSFIARKEEEYTTNKTKKSMFKAAMLTVTESIFPIYKRARIPTKTDKKLCQDIISNYKQMQNILKIKKANRDFGKAKERIELFKKKLKETMVCWPKDVWTKLENEEDKAFLMSMQSDRIATMVGRDMKTYNLENRKRKQKKAESKLILSEKERRDENAVAVLEDSNSDDSGLSHSSIKETSDIPTRKHKRLKKTGIDICL